MNQSIVKKINLKRLSVLELEKLVVGVIEDTYVEQSNQPTKTEILDMFLKKFKIKPYKKIFGNKSFIDYCLYNKKYQLLNNYVPNLNLAVPNYNVINTCVAANNIELLKKYISVKNININQLVDGETPITLAIKNRYIECFDILIKNGANIKNIDGRYYTTFFILIEQVLSDHETNTLTDEKTQIYMHMLHSLLPMDFKGKYSDSKIETMLSNLVDSEKVFDSEFLNNAIHHHNLTDEDYYKKIIKEERLNGPTKEITDFKRTAIETQRNFFVKALLYENNISFENDDLVQVRKLLLAKLDVFFNYLINSRPHLLILDDYILTKSTCDAGNDSIVENLLTHNRLLATEPETICFSLMGSGKFKYVKKMTDMFPHLLTNKKFAKCLIIYALSSDLPDDEIIQCVDFFIEMGADIDYFDDDASCLDIAIGNNSNKVVEYILNLSDKSIINYLITAIQHERPDTFKMLAEAGCAISINPSYKTNPKGLYELYGIDDDDSDEDSDDLNELCRLEKINKSNDPDGLTNTSRKIPRSVIYAIKSFNYEILKYIVESPIFNLTEKELQYLFKFAKSLRAPDIILNLLKKDHPITDTNVDFDLLRLRGLFSTYVGDFATKRQETILCVKVLTLLLDKVINEPEEKLYKSLAFYEEQRFAREYSEIMYNTETLRRCCLVIGSYIKPSVGMRQDGAIYNFCNDIITENFRPIDEVNYYKECFNKFDKKIKDLILLLNKLFADVVDDDECDFDEYLRYMIKSEIEKQLNAITENKLTKSDKLTKPTNLTDLTDLTNLTDSADSADSADSDESTESDNFDNINQSTNTINITNTINSTNTTIKISKEFIEDRLTLLTYPFVLENYGFLKDRMLRENINVIETTDNYSFFRNNKKIAIVYKNKYHDIVPCWFSKYGYNIGTMLKQDYNHMFSFGIDYYINNIWDKCIIKCKYYNINKFKLATCVYFKGALLKNNVLVEGNFEYFINHKGVLFHRLFKPHRRQYLTNNNNVEAI